MNRLHFAALPAVKAGQRFVAAGLPGAADACLLARYARTHTAGRALLTVLCADAVDAQRLADEIQWFDPALRVRVLPDWETLPYDNFSPHQDLTSARLATLYDVARGDCDVVVVPVVTALLRLPPPAFRAYLLL